MARFFSIVAVGAAATQALADNDLRPARPAGYSWKNENSTLLAHLDQMVDRKMDDPRYVHLIEDAFTPKVPGENFIASVELESGKGKLKKTGKSFEFATTTSMEHMKKDMFYTFATSYDAATGTLKTRENSICSEGKLKEKDAMASSPNFGWLSKEKYIGRLAIRGVAVDCFAARTKIMMEKDGEKTVVSNLIHFAAYDKQDALPRFFAVYNVQSVNRKMSVYWTEFTNWENADAEASQLSTVATFNCKSADPARCKSNEDPKWQEPEYEMLDEKTVDHPDMLDLHLVALNPGSRSSDKAVNDRPVYDLQGVTSLFCSKQNLDAFETLTVADVRVRQDYAQAATYTSLNGSLVSSHVSRDAVGARSVFAIPQADGTVSQCAKSTSGMYYSLPQRARCDSSTSLTTGETNCAWRATRFGKTVRTSCVAQNEGLKKACQRDDGLSPMKRAPRAFAQAVRNCH